MLCYIMLCSKSSLAKYKIEIEVLMMAFSLHLQTTMIMTGLTGQRTLLLEKLTELDVSLLVVEVKH